jgi:hypothetical protein
MIKALAANREPPKRTLASLLSSAKEMSEALLWASSPLGSSIGNACICFIEQLDNLLKTFFAIVRVPCPF